MIGFGQPRLRKAQAADLPAIDALGRRVLADHFPSRPWLSHWIEGSREIGVIAEQSYHCLGFALAQWSEDRYTLFALAVHSSYSRRGLGGRLLEAVESEACRLGAAVLVFRLCSDNIPAITLGSRAGFTPKAGTALVEAEPQCEAFVELCKKLAR